MDQSLYLPVRDSWIRFRADTDIHDARTGPVSESFPDAGHETLVSNTFRKNIDNYYATKDKEHAQNRRRIHLLASKYPSSQTN